MGGVAGIKLIVAIAPIGRPSLLARMPDSETLVSHSWVHCSFLFTNKEAMHMVSSSYPFLCFFLVNHAKHNWS